MAEDERFTQSRQYSKYNDAGFKVNRINYLWEQSLMAKQEGKLNKYDNFISSVLDEILPDAKLILSDGDYERHTESLSEINKKITKYRKKSNRNLIFYWLKIKERRARLIQNEIGSGAKIVQKEDKGKAVYK